MIITHNIQTDLIDAPSIPRIHVVQGDYYSRSVAVTLLAGGKPWSVPEDAFVAIRYCKPDGTKGSYDTLPDGTPAWKLENGGLILFLAPQMTTVSGCVNAQVEMVHDNQILATFSFQILVAKDDSGTFLTSQDYFNWQQWVNEQLDTRLQEAVDGNLFTGATPNLTIGTVTSLASGASASASIRGTAENPILDLALPRGKDAVVYPVGAVYISTNSTSPASLFGGTWEQITQRFLFAAHDDGGFPSGTTGGEAVHTLTVNEIPSHAHNLAHFASPVGGTIWGGLGTSGENVYWENAQATTATGGGQAHNNMPPYLAVYMWKRVA